MSWSPDALARYVLAQAAAMAVRDEVVFWRLLDSLRRAEAPLSTLPAPKAPKRSQKRTEA